MTIQQIFNKVAKHLITQNKKSKLGRNCAYRTENGLSCAIGCLISDKLYKSSGLEKAECDGHTFDLNGLSSHFPGVYDSIVDNNNRFTSHNLLDTLQMIHDWEHPNAWRKSLIHVAKTFGLRLPDCLKTSQKG